MSKKGNKAYKSWAKIKERCFVETNKDYYKYGAIGITMYEGWRNNFQAFYDHIGDPPNTNEAGYSIDRIENSLGYVPGNIRWATDYQQARNKSKHKSIKLELLVCNGMKKFGRVGLNQPSMPKLRGKRIKE